MMKRPGPFLAYLAASHGYIDARTGKRPQRAGKGLKQAYNRGYGDGQRIEAMRAANPDFLRNS